MQFILDYAEQQALSNFSRAPDLQVCRPLRQKPIRVWSQVINDVSSKNVNYNVNDVHTVDDVATRYCEQCIGYKLVDGVDHAVRE